MESGSAIVNALRIGYRRAGAGPPLFLLHGIGSDSRSWRHQLSGLADTFDVIAWDLRGYGGSDDAPGPYVMADLADDLARLIAQLGFGRAHVCGLSFGGVVAQEFAGRHLGRLDRLILADTLTGHGHLPAEERERRLQARLRAADDLPALAEARAATLLSPEAPPELLAEVKAIMRELRPEGYRLAARALSWADTRPLLPFVRVPTLVLWGEQDTVCSLDEAKAIQAGIARARLEIVPKAGHVSNQENPEAFNELVRRFLTEQRPAELPR